VGSLSRRTGSKLGDGLSICLARSVFTYLWLDEAQYRTSVQLFFSIHVASYFSSTFSKYPSRTCVMSPLYAHSSVNFLFGLGLCRFGNHSI
jgi:hypothetical protein